MRLRATRLSAISNSMRSVFKIASVNPVLWWDAESHRAALAGGAATLFQDAAGASAVSAVEQPVGRAVDQSGNTRHALQATSTARPVLTARKNLLTFSEQFGNAAWTPVNATVSANTTTAPDGTTTADTLVETTDNGLHVAIQVVGFASNSRFTISVFAKASTRSWVYLRENNGSATSAYFNIAAGVVGSVEPGTTASIQSVGNGWYRCTISGTTASAQTSVNMNVRIATGNNIDSYAGNGSGIFVWGAQIETGSTATSYQRVTTATDYDIAAAPLMLQFDGADDSLATSPFPAGTLPANADVYVVLNRGTDSQMVLLSSTIAADRFIFCAESNPGFASDSSGSPTYAVNGAAVPGGTSTSRSQLLSAIPANQAVVLEARGANLSSWDRVFLGAYIAGFQLTGRAGCLFISEAKPDSVRRMIRKDLAKRYQIQGVV